MRSVTGEPVSCGLNAPAAAKGQTLDSYLIRIYRRGAENGRELAGLVERIGNGKRLAFGTSEELWAFLTERRLARGRIAGNKPGKARR